MKTKEYDLLDWLETMSDSGLSDINQQKWNEYLNSTMSNEIKVIITDNGVKRWMVKSVSQAGKLEYFPII
ncbi:MAG TPA: hypothetical protein PKD16_17985 [Saprospiraceae bacterium]|jgi:hypothetical protein|nr:hypothetical protein [Saprospiraceae bacterium]HMT72064.1 hypothetical protein [Saprospiraceae bacterium]